MKSCVLNILQLLALATCGTALAQEQVDPQMTTTSPCGTGDCANIAFQKAADSSLTWYSFRPNPDDDTDQVIVRAAGTQPRSSMFTRQAVIPLVQNKQTLAQSLAHIQELRLVTLWRNHRSKIFLGVDNNGLAGLNYSQWSRPTPVADTDGSNKLLRQPTGPLSPPLLHSQSLTYEKKDLGSVADPEYR